MSASTATSTAIVDARLIALDPDFDELVAEVEKALRVARVRWMPRLLTTGAPQPPTAGSRHPSSRPRGAAPSSVPGTRTQPTRTPQKTPTPAPDAEAR